MAQTLLDMLFGPVFLTGYPCWLMVVVVVVVGGVVSVWKSGPVRFFGQISTDRNRNRLPIMARPQIIGPDRK